MVDPSSVDPIIEIVRTAAETILPGAGTVSASDTKDDGSVVTETDLRLQRYIADALEARWPGTALIGEEMTHREQERILRGAASGFWCLDPLDGTTNFSAGFPFYGISLAFVSEGLSRIAVVYDPIRRECFHARRGHGAYLNGEPLHCGDGVALRDCVANVDYKRLMSRVAERLVRSPPYRSQRNLGASVLEWCWLAAGRFHLYLHGGQKLWDYAAGSLILTEAGGAAKALDGSEIDCGSLSKRSVIAAAGPRLLSAWHGWVRQSL